MVLCIQYSIIAQGFVVETSKVVLLRIPRWLRRKGVDRPRCRDRYRGSTRCPLVPLVYRFETVSCNQVARNGVLHIMRLRKVTNSGWRTNESNFALYLVNRRLAMRRRQRQLMQLLRHRLIRLQRRRTPQHSSSTDFLFRP